MPLHAAYIIRIYIPIDVGSTELTADLPTSLIGLGERAPGLERVLDVIKATPGIGLMGNYNNVVELSLGEEWYLPKEGAHPTKGRIGTPDGGRAVVVTTYGVGMTRPSIDAFVEKVVAVHPWEHPVIEIFAPGGRPLLWCP